MCLTLKFFVRIFQVQRYLVEATLDVEEMNPHGHFSLSASFAAPTTELTTRVIPVLELPKF
jgi:hypothetical protein